MKTIATFSKPEEAHLLRMRLEAAGIPAFVQDEDLVQVDWLLSNAIGGVRVEVAEDDFAEAIDFLSADAPQAQPDDESVRCPYCGEKDTKPSEGQRRLSFLSVLLFHFPLPVDQSRWVCNRCHRTFRLP